MFGTQLICDREIMSQTTFQERNIQRLRALVLNRYIQNAELIAFDRNVQLYPVLPVTNRNGTQKSRGIWQRISPAGEYF